MTGGAGKGSRQYSGSRSGQGSRQDRAAGRTGGAGEGNRQDRGTRQNYGIRQDVFPTFNTSPPLTLGE